MPQKDKLLKNCATGRPASGLEMQMLTDSHLYIDVLDNLNLSTGEQQALLLHRANSMYLELKSVHVCGVFIPHGSQGQMMPLGHNIKYIRTRLVIAGGSTAPLEPEVILSIRKLQHYSQSAEQSMLGKPTASLFTKCQTIHWQAGLLYANILGKLKRGLILLSSPYSCS